MARRGGTMANPISSPSRFTNFMAAMAIITVDSIARRSTPEKRSLMDEGRSILSRTLKPLCISLRFMIDRAPPVIIPVTTSRGNLREEARAMIPTTSAALR